MSNDYMPAFPKPGQGKKPPKPAVKVMKDGREVCDLLTKGGRDEYRKRVKLMLERQKGRCCLEGYIEGCPGRLAFNDATFEHSAGRGNGSGHRDDRIEVNGKMINGAAHYLCNSKKGSRRIDYNACLETP